MLTRLLLPLLALILTGCESHRYRTDAPPAISFNSRSQRSMHSAQNWQVVAKRIAIETAEIRAADAEIAPLPVYVAEPATPTHFDRAFKTLLESHFMNLGVPVSIAPGAITQINCATQIIPHERRNTEVLVTVSITSGSRLVMNRSSVYWVAADEDGLYAHLPPRQEQAALPPRERPTWYLWWR